MNPKGTLNWYFAVTLILTLIVSCPACAADTANQQHTPTAATAIDSEGKPADTLPGAPVRYTVWHDSEGWHLRAAAAALIHHFRGAIVVGGGSFTNVKPYRPQVPGLQKDLFIVSPDNRTMKFDFTAKAGVEGVDFRVAGQNPMLEFSLAVGENEPVYDPSRVFIGEAGAHPREIPFTLPAHGRQGSPIPAPNTAAQRAKMAWEALQKNYAIPNQPGAYYEDLSRNKQAFVWPQSQAIHAALDIGQLTGDYSDFHRAEADLSRYVLIKNGIFSYASGVNAPKDTKRWWDDNGWVALALLQAAEQIPNPPSLESERRHWAFFKSGQAPQGGEWENETFVARGIPSGGTTIEVALRLYLAAETSKDPNQSEYLKVARATDEFIEKNISAPGGLYWGGYYDDVTKSPFYDKASGRACKPERNSLPPPPEPLPKANVCVWMSVMSNGLMIRSDVLFYRITHDEAYIDRAVHTANATLEHFPLEWMWKQSPFEVAVLFRNLFALDAVRPDPRYRAVLEAYLEKAWNEARDPATGLFKLGGVGMSNQKEGFGVLDQAGFVQMYALLAWPQNRFKDLN